MPTVNPICINTTSPPIQVAITSSGSGSPTRYVWYTTNDSTTNGSVFSVSTPSQPSNIYDAFGTSTGAATFYPSVNQAGTFGIMLL